MKAKYLKRVWLFLLVMNLYEQANIDIQKITSNPVEWGAVITLTASTGEIAIVNGIHTKHHLNIDTTGNIINSKNASVAISEAKLIAANPHYPIRNINNEVNFKNHLVNVKDSTEIDKNYIIQSWIPDETVGLIVCILEDYA